MSFKLDFNNLKHVSSDKDSTTLQHPAGHTITLKHNVLPKDAQAHLKAMADAAETPDQKSADSQYGKVQMKADGGGVQYDSSGYPIKNSSGSNSAPPAAPNQEKAKGFASVFKAEGGPINGTKAGVANTFQQSDSDKAATHAVQHPIDTLSSALGFANGGGVPQSLQKPDDYAKSNPQMPAININLGGMAPGAQQATDQQAPAQQPAQTPQSPASQGIQAWKNIAAPPAPEQPPQGDFLHPAPDSVLGKAAGVPQPAPVPDTSQVPDASAQPSADASSDAQAMDPSSPAAAQDTPDSTPAASQSMPRIAPGDAYLHQVDAIKQDFDNGHITPKTYKDLFNDKSTLGKIGTIFGLLVGGAGAGLSKQPNMLLSMMDNEISRDLEAQKATKSNQTNFMKLADEHVMSVAGANHMNAETGMLRDQLAYQYASRSAFHDMLLKTQAMPDGPAKQQALQTLGMVSQSLDARAMQAKDMINAKSSLYNTMSGSSQDPASQLRMKQVAGVITPAQYAEGLKELGNVQNHVQMNKNAIDSFNNLTKMATVGSYLSNPIQNQKRIDAEWGPMIEKLTKDTDGRVTPITVDMMGDIRPRVGDDAKTTRIKRQKFESIVNGGLATPALDSLGIRVDKGYSPTNPQPVKGKDGKMYVQQGNYMVPVGN